ncbi:hypothetical protein N9O61_01790 [Octadecabacter sp.]|nr:hypothetical protein [Octadecabacter sp.]
MKHILAALAICAATPVMAQDRMSLDQCVQSWGVVFGLTGLPIAQLQVDVDSSGWCIIQEGTFAVDGGSRVRVDRLKWRASEIDRLISDGLPPRSLEIYGERLGVLPQTGDPVYDYLLGLQTRETEVGFGVSARWDGVQNAIVVDEGYVVFDETNRIDVTGRVDGLDLTDMASIQSSFGTMGLKSLELKTTFDGWFEDYLALAIGVAVLTEPNVAPEVQVAGLQQHAIGFISEAPEAVLPDVARDALSAFITDLPTPRGTLQVQLNADPVIGALRLAPLGFADAEQDRLDLLETVLDGVRLLVTWSPTRE